MVLLLGERNLQEVFSRIRTEKDAEMALKAAELFRRYRASREQHTPFKISTSKMIVQVPCPCPFPQMLEFGCIWSTFSTGSSISGS